MYIPLYCQRKHITYSRLKYDDIIKDRVFTTLVQKINSIEF